MQLLSISVYTASVCSGSAAPAVWGLSAPALPPFLHLQDSKYLDGQTDGIREALQLYTERNKHNNKFVWMGSELQRSQTDAGPSSASFVKTSLLFSHPQPLVLAKSPDCYINLYLHRLPAPDWLAAG